MSIYTTLIPGVYSDFSVKNSSLKIQNSKAVALWATAGSEVSSSTVYTLRSYEEALSIFGTVSTDNNMLKYAKILFENGCSKIYAMRATASNLNAAMIKFLKENSVQIITGDMRTQSELSSVKSRLNDGRRIGYNAICIAGTDLEVTNDIINLSETVDSKYIVITASRPKILGESQINSSASAVALAGIISATNDPALPYNNALVKGIDLIESEFTREEMESLIEGGITLIENGPLYPYVVRMVTSCISEVAYRDLNTTLIVDDVMSALKSVVLDKFSRAKKNSITVNAIISQLVLVLEAKKDAEIIASYNRPVATEVENDNTAMVFNISFEIISPLGKIILNADIDV